MSLLQKIVTTIMGLRKWSIMLLILIVGIAFRVTELLTGVEFVSLIKGVSIAFMSSNAVEHLKDFVVAKIKGKD